MEWEVEAEEVYTRAARTWKLPREEEATPRDLLLRVLGRDVDVAIAAVSAAQRGGNWGALSDDGEDVSLAKLWSEGRHRVRFQVLLGPGGLRLLSTPKSAESWKCSRCTYLNEVSVESCSVCELPRSGVPDVASAVPGAAPAAPVCNTCFGDHEERSCPVIAESLQLSRPAQMLTRSTEISEPRREVLKLDCGANVLPDGAGVLFCFWSPSAYAVSVAGTFNRWRGQEMLPSATEHGMWSCVVPEAREVTRGEEMRCGDASRWRSCTREIPSLD
jgi:hypothetical protein